MTSMFLGLQSFAGLSFTECSNCARIAATAAASPHALAMIDDGTGATYTYEDFGQTLRHAVPACVQWTAFVRCLLEYSSREAFVCFNSAGLALPGTCLKARQSQTVGIVGACYGHEDTKTRTHEDTKTRRHRKERRNEAAKRG